MLQSKCCYDLSVGHQQSTEDVLLVVVVEIVKCVIVLCFCLSSVKHLTIVYPK